MKLQITNSGPKRLSDFDELLVTRLKRGIIKVAFFLDYALIYLSG